MTIAFMSTPSVTHLILNCRWSSSGMRIVSTFMHYEICTRYRLSVKPYFCLAVLAAGTQSGVFEQRRHPGVRVIVFMHPRLVQPQGFCASLRRADEGAQC